MTLIPQWRRAWRLFSVQAGVVLLAWGVLPVDQQTAILSLVGIGPERVPAIMGLLVIAGRLIQQPAAEAAQEGQHQSDGQG